MDKNKLLRRLPAVNDLLEEEAAEQLIVEFNRELVVKEIRRVLDEARAELLGLLAEGDLQRAEKLSGKLSPANLLERLERALEERLRPNLAPAVNATGVIVHTNLGRSLLSRRAKEMMEMAGSHYTTLEIDRQTGERGSRYDNIEELLCELTGAEAAFVVNNNAAAVLLALSALAAGREVIISRGELIEIGGSFRIPDVMKQGGARLVEVGTTNKVYAEDYEEAITEETALLLKVHTSNYRVVGFTRDVKLEELVEVGRKHDLPVLDDLGSGVFLDMKEFGLQPEPTAAERVAAGADIVTFSGDKILGGPQAGIVVGKSEYIARLKKHPLTRAVRVDKYTLAALEGTLKAYLDPEGVIDEIPTLKMLSLGDAELKESAEGLKQAIKKLLPGEEFSVEVEKDISRVGGGAYPLSELPTRIVSLRWSAGKIDRVAAAIRTGYPPVFTRLADDRMIFDVRTLQQDDEDIICRALESAFDEILN